MRNLYLYLWKYTCSIYGDDNSCYIYIRTFKTCMFNTVNVYVDIDTNDIYSPNIEILYGDWSFQVTNFTNYISGLYTDTFDKYDYKLTISGFYSILSRYQKIYNC